MRIMPSSITSVFFESAPRINTDEVVPMPPLEVTKTPGTVLRRSSTVWGFLCSISSVVITVTLLPPISDVVVSVWVTETTT